MSAYYDWCGRAPSDREVEDRRLAVEVRTVHRESRQTYGARRVHAELQARGVACGRHRVGRLMREGGLVARGPKRKPPKATPSTPVADNVLDRAFEPDAPDRVWTAAPVPPRRAGTYIPTDEGWLYLAVVVDRAGRTPAHSRRVVGWAARPSLGRELATAALDAALRDRRPDPGLVHHSDQGTQYTSSDYRAMLRRHELVCSMSRRRAATAWAGIRPAHNAPTESLFGSLKTECVRGERFATHDEASAALFDYLAFYNHRRRHSALDYQSPAEHERRHHARRGLRLAA